MSDIFEEMKGKVQEFTAYQIEFPPTSAQISLELLPDPIYKYSDKEKKIEAGAVFAFVRGDNPEVLLTLEVYEAQSDFSCEFVRLGGAEMHVLHKGREVWKSDSGVGMTGGAYRSFKYNNIEPVVAQHQKHIEAQITQMQHEKQRLLEAIETMKSKASNLETESQRLQDLLQK